MKTITQMFFALMLMLMASTMSSSGQSIKDFVLPNPHYNKAIFYKPSKTGGRTNFSRIIYYDEKADQHNIMDAQMYKNEPMSILTMTVKFSENEANMVESVSTNEIETNKRRWYNVPRTTFKMPSANAISVWLYTDIKGDEMRCTSSWTTVTVGDDQRIAIKVVKEIIGLNSKIIEYYVEGIGLWRTDMENSDGTTEILEKFDKLEYEPSRR
ncbi:MAG: hypothetical protein H0V01_13930 [Bacteroidetes bacterium]|nr:hypothetical protein [Bacteroidota bacterium]HET6245379.1 hypothetical protein [Bacteroidia bacterium]